MCVFRRPALLTLGLSLLAGPWSNTVPMIFSCVDPSGGPSYAGTLTPLRDHGRNSFPTGLSPRRNPISEVMTMTCESFERSTGRCRKRGGSGCSIGFLRGRKRVLVMVMIIVLLLTSVVPLVPLNPIDANYSGTKYTVVYHKDVGSGTTVEVEYRGSFISTEYNPQFWEGTIGASGGKIL